MKHRLLALLTVAVVVSSSGSAVAQPSTSLADRETARSLMDDADKKRDAGDLKTALRNYQAADAIMKVPTTGLEVARTQIALGQLLEARETLGQVLHSVAKAGEPAPFAVARKTADTMNTEVAARIPSVLVVVSNTEPGQPAQITIDDEPIPPAAAAVPRKVNPGKHVIAVRSGSLQKSQEVSVAERENKTVSVDLADQPPPSPPPPVEPTASSNTTPKVLMYAGFGVGIVGVGVGAVTGLMSLSQTRDLQSACPNNACPKDRQGDIDSATSLGNVSTVAFIVGGVGVGVGVVGLLLSRSDKSAPPPSAARLPRVPARAFAPERVRAVLGPAYVGVAGAF